MRKEIKSMWKKITAYVLTACFLLVAIWVTPVQKANAMDGGDGWGHDQIVEFKGKNTTWNVSTNKSYSIATGNRSRNWTKVTLKSSNSSVVDPEAFVFGKGFVDLYFQTGNKAGKVTLTMTVKEKKKTYKYKFKVVVRKYENPFTELKIDAKKIQKKFNRNIKETELSVKSGKHTIRAKLKKNWKITSILFWDGKIDKDWNITKSKKFKLSDESGELTITVQNKKTKENRKYTVYLNNVDSKEIW